MFTLTDHAYRKINGDVSLAYAVGRAANNPSVTYANGRVAGQQRRIRDGIVAVCDPRTEKIITFYKNVEETDLRADQTDTDAQDYAAKRAARMAKQAQKRAERKARDRALTFALKGGKK